MGILVTLVLHAHLKIVVWVTIRTVFGQEKNVMTGMIDVMELAVTIVWPSILVEVPQAAVGIITMVTVTLTIITCAMDIHAPTVTDTEIAMTGEIAFGAV